MISKKIEKALNEQIHLEHESSQYYLAMASWAQINGLHGTSRFLYNHSDEERMHMLKLFHYVNDRGGHAQVPTATIPKKSFKNVQEIFELILKHEVLVTKEIHGVVDICLQEKDYTTHNFMQWYVAEQIEEENLARHIIDKLNLIQQDKGGLYLFDRDLETMSENVHQK
jgi:ferritin